MPCYHPVQGYQARLGGFTASKVQGWPDKPMQVPCGQCAGCRLERARQWAVRCMHEADSHESNCFVTLTFDDYHLKKMCDGHTVRVSHLQDFMKRIRKRYVPKNPYPDKDDPRREQFKRAKGIRFFACGEYGEKGGRPHYHALLFNHDYRDKKFWKKSDSGENLYTSESLERSWPFGFCSLGRVSFLSAAYVAKYSMKKVTGEQSAEHYTWISEYGEIHQRRPEFLIMSRNPGIGAYWLDRFGTDVYPRDEVIVNGHPQRPPRFYDARWHSEPSNFQLSDAASRMSGKRKREAKKFAHDNTPERLAVKEKVTLAKLNLHGRSL